MFSILYAVLACILILVLVFSCKSTPTIVEQPDYYNVIYNQAGNIIEYYDVTQVIFCGEYITFTTCDGASVILSAGAIEIIPIDYE